MKSSTKQGIKDVLSGRAALQGLKVIYNGTIGNALNVERKHAKDNGYDSLTSQQKKNFKRVQ